MNARPRLENPCKIAHNETVRETFSPPVAELLEPPDCAIGFDETGQWWVVHERDGGLEFYRYDEVES